MMNGMDPRMLQMLMQQGGGQPGMMPQEPFGQQPQMPGPMDPTGAGVQMPQNPRIMALIQALQGGQR